jgi:carboxylesterase type B
MKLCQGVLLLAFNHLCCVLAADGPIVATLYGKIQGKYTSTAQVFTSIPYARPPTNELRWKYPVPPEPWEGVIETVADPPGCPQSIPCNLPLPELTCPKRVTEDCLYLNVFTPLSAQPDAKIPVMVFFHGGNFLRGYSGGFLYDGQYIANTSSTVVVTVNYRLGAIGFLVFGEGSDAIEGNYGFKDQRLALHWVQDNIAAFGGDPGQVTIWGQSAGAVSVALHMTTVRSSGLFNKAIMESEPIELTLKDRKHALKLGTDFSKELGCGDKDNIACLYSKNITLISAVEDALLSKIVDPLQ